MAANGSRRLLPRQQRTGFPPGVRFRPTDLELLEYLTQRVLRELIEVDEFHDVNVYSHHPRVLLGNPTKGKVAVFDPGEKLDRDGEKKVFLFSPRDRKYPNGERPCRSVAGFGFWKASGKAENIKNEAGEEVGTKRSLSFYEGHQGKDPVKTAWLGQEFKIAASRRPPEPTKGCTTLDDFVLYVVYLNGNSNAQGKEPTGQNSSAKGKELCHYNNDATAKEVCGQDGCGAVGDPDEPRTSNGIHEPQVGAVFVQTMGEELDAQYNIANGTGFCMQDGQLVDPEKPRTANCGHAPSVGVDFAQAGYQRRLPDLIYYRATGRHDVNASNFSNMDPQTTSTMGHGDMGMAHSCMPESSTQYSEFDHKSYGMQRDYVIPYVAPLRMIMPQEVNMVRPPPGCNVPGPSEQHSEYINHDGYGMESCFENRGTSSVLLPPPSLEEFPDMFSFGEGSRIHDPGFGEGSSGNVPGPSEQHSEFINYNGYRMESSFENRGTSSALMPPPIHEGLSNILAAALWSFARIQDPGFGEGSSSNVPGPCEQYSKQINHLGYDMVNYGTSSKLSSPPNQEGLQYTLAAAMPPLAWTQNQGVGEGCSDTKMEAPSSCDPIGSLAPLAICKPSSQKRQCIEHDYRQSSADTKIDTMSHGYVDTQIDSESYGTQLGGSHPCGDGSFNGWSSPSWEQWNVPPEDLGFFDCPEIDYDLFSPDILEDALTTQISDGNAGLHAQSGPNILDGDGAPTAQISDGNAGLHAQSGPDIVHGAPTAQISDGNAGLHAQPSPDILDGAPTAQISDGNTGLHAQPGSEQ